MYSMVKSKTFKKKHYSSGNGMLTSVWGPPLWHFLHTMSFNYPVKPTKNEKKNYRNFILQLKYILPCRYCRENLRKNLKVHPLLMRDMKNRETFSRWVYELHEIVNKMLGKKSGLSYNDVRDRYENFRSRCTIDKDEFTRQKNKLLKMKRSKTRKRKKNKKEKGCVEPLYGKKSKCVINIVPQEKKCKTFQVDEKCVLKRKITKTQKKKD